MKLYGDVILNAVRTFACVLMSERERHQKDGECVLLRDTSIMDY